MLNELSKVDNQILISMLPFIKFGTACFI
jgi:hypothetical protein